MKKFIFITPEGNTTAPNGDEVENMQVIGIVEEVTNENEALKKLLLENEWIFDTQFNIAAFYRIQALVISIARILRLKNLGIAAVQG